MLADPRIAVTASSQVVSPQWPFCNLLRSVFKLFKLGRLDITLLIPSTENRFRVSGKPMTNAADPYYGV